MKKLLSIVLVAAMCVSLAACGSKPSDTTPQPIMLPPQTEAPEMEAPNPTPGTTTLGLIDSGKVPKYPTRMMSTLIESDNIVFYNTPKIIYTTPASENGLGDTYMYVYGRVKEIGEIKGYRHIFIETDDGIIGLLNTSESMDENFSKNIEWEFMDADESYGFFFVYSGFSEVTKTASGIFCNLEIADGVSEENMEKIVSDKKIASGKQKLSELITITDVSTSKPNSADGVDVSVKWSNNSEKTIKYITFCLQAYNAVDDTVKCDIRDYSLFYLEATGPFDKDEMNASTEKNAWYNHNIVRANIYSIEIEYMDGTSEFIRDYEVGNEWIQFQ